ncbi:helix-turn-helix domain-containing protein [Roseburia sp. 499]|uniref:helix-turn-helix domain-containing protein n=1 Tax=Roseburia sp. 499 TaxID=1261634 RepID=UPI0009521ACB|nr:helix-turn-helix transcriptional regulator [Roseburia sp. 499]WVK70291.1 helix-turn-helix transcriptional regulator [Roseburia sp. 499]
MNFSVRLENLIEENNITQKQLSTELHIAATTLNGYVNNHREPDFHTLIRLARYFDVSTDYLLGLTDEKKPIPSSLNSAEGTLIRLYRTLLPERQELLIEQAMFYQKLDNKSQKSSNHKGEL